MVAETERLKELLNKEINATPIDHSKILDLSIQIANLDNDAVRFTVDAGLINRLGKELVGRHETAVAELVKNAYDADATEVTLYFFNAENEGGVLIITDNGIGMTKEQLINGFMRLSSTDKIHNPISLKYKRKRAGKKGIGRFAAQRLGRSLSITTQTNDTQNALKIQIEWDNFKDDEDLITIKNKIESVDKERDEGTTLVLYNLRDSWSDAKIKRAYRYTSELLQPFPLSEKAKNFEIDRIDPGFSSKYGRLYGDHTTKLIVDDNEAFFQHATATIGGYVDGDGQGYWSLKSPKFGHPEKKFQIGKERSDPTSKFHSLFDVHFKCYYFIYKSGLIPRGTESFIRSVAKDSGGIRLYNNGFRVLPYGEKGNDWVHLDESATRRTYLFPHQNINFFGFVEINDDTGTFEETSSREGFIENEAFEELQDFVYRSIISAGLRLQTVRRKRSPKKDIISSSDSIVTPEEKVDAAISNLKKVIKKEPVIKLGTIEKESLSKALQNLTEARTEEKSSQLKFIEEMNMLRILAGLGLVIGEFVHEVRRFLPGFDTDIKFLKEAVKDIKKAVERVERLDVNLKGFSSYTSYFYTAVSRNVLRELESIEIRDVVYDFEEAIRDDIKASNLTFHKPIFKGYDLWTVPMHKSEWASILFNLYTNSKKAIQKANRKGGVLIECGKQDNSIFLTFSDNGIGIPIENEELIFDAFFTTTSAAGIQVNDNESLSGIGLGLKIVKDIIESYGGEIYVDSPSENFTTTIRIVIPQSTGTNYDR